MPMLPEAFSRAIYSAAMSIAMACMAVCLAAVLQRTLVGTRLAAWFFTDILAPLLAPLGLVPEARCAAYGVQPRVWYEPLSGGGLLVSWEDLLLDRLPGRRVSFQAEMRPNGDCTFRYDFKDALATAPTNFVIGTQVGTNAVNALAILGTNILSATIWRIDDTPVTNGVSLADILCTNGVLRTPARFALEWKNTTGVSREADADADGLPDWQEFAIFGTDPDQPDTDGDGIRDGDEIAAGTVRMRRMFSPHQRLR